MLSSKVTVEVDVNPQDLIKELIDLEEFYGRDKVEKQDNNYLLNVTLKGTGSKFNFRMPVYVHVSGNRVYHIGTGETNYMASFEVIGTSKGTLLIAWAQLKAGRKAWFMGARLDLFLKELVDAAIARAMLKHHLRGGQV